VLSELAGRCTYAPFVSAVYDSSLAFIVLTRSVDAGIRFSTAAATYAAAHPSVRHTALTGEATQPLQTPLALQRPCATQQAPPGVRRWRRSGFTFRSGPHAYRRLQRVTAA
jgi:hypothetical protein